MIVKLKRVCCFDGKDYGKGTHELPNSLAEQWFFQAIVKDGHAEVLEFDGDEPVEVAIPPSTDIHQTLGMQMNHSEDAGNKLDSSKEFDQSPASSEEFSDLAADEDQESHAEEMAEEVSDELKPAPKSKRRR